MEDITQYKNNLIKLWKQKSESFKDKLLISNSSYDIKEKLCKINIKDDYLNDLIKTSFKDNLITIQWEYLIHSDKAYYYRIDKKFLTLNRISINIKTDNSEMIFYKKEKPFFGIGKEQYIKYKKYFNQLTTTDLDNILKNNTNDIIGCLGKSYYHNSCYNIKIFFSLLSFNNIFIPITLDEEKALLKYELDCRKNEDLDDVHRNLTLLTPTEYKEFVKWKESQKENNI